MYDSDPEYNQFRPEEDVLESGKRYLNKIAQKLPQKTDAAIFTDDNLIDELNSKLLILRNLDIRDPGLKKQITDLAIKVSSIHMAALRDDKDYEKIFRWINDIREYLRFFY